MTNREQDLWGDSYNELDNDDPNQLSKNDFKSDSNERTYDTKILDYRSEQFFGMRSDGGVSNYRGFSIAEYEDRGLRLKFIAEKIKSTVINHFVLYDYKGSVFTNNKQALSLLKSNYHDYISIDGGDELAIIDEPFEPKGNAPQVISKPTSYRHETSESIESSILPSKASVSIPRNVNYRNVKPSFDIKGIARTLSSIIKKVPNRGGMMVGIFGKWGRGKTFLFDNIWKELQIETNYQRVNFSAWKYQDTKESWAYLYESLLKQFLDDSGNSSLIMKRLNYWKKLWNLNLQKYTWTPIFMFSMTALMSIYWTFYVDKFEFIKLLISSVGVLFLFKLLTFYFQQRASAIGMLNKFFHKPNFDDYLGLQAEIEKEIENLLLTWIPEINENKKIILFVDDIDRCTLEKIVPIIDGLRVILDNKLIHERLIIVTAIDENMLEQAIRIRYPDYEDISIKKVHKEYLEKVFIIGIKLSTLATDEVEEFFSNILHDNNVSVVVEEKQNPISFGEATFSDSENTVAQDLNTGNNTKKGHETNSIQKSIEEEEDDFELTFEERKYLLASIPNLEDPSPRKLKIFYYKYLILKQLFHINLKTKQLEADWNENGNEMLIADVLISVSNNKIDSFADSSLSPKLLEALKYSAKMVSPF